MRELGAPRWAAMAAIAVLVIALVVLVFRLGNQASAGVALDDPVVWIEDGSNGQVLQINGSTLEVTARVRVGDNGDSIIAVPSGRNAVFFNRTTGTIGTIGAVSLEIDNEVEVEDPIVRDLVTGDNVELIADLDVASEAFLIRDDRTYVVEPGSAGVDRLTPPGGIGDLEVTYDGRLLVVTGDGRQILKSVDEGLVSYVTLPEPISDDAQQPQIVRSGGELWVVDPDRRIVNGIGEDGQLTTPTCVSGSLSEVVVGGTSLTTTSEATRVLVLDSEAGVLSVSQPDQSDCYAIELDAVDRRYGPPVAVDSTAFLPNWASGDVEVIDLDEGVLLDRHRVSAVPGRPFELEVFDNAVWANEPNGPFASIITATGFERVTKAGLFTLTPEGQEETVDGPGAFVAGEGDAPERTFGDVGEDVLGGGGEAGIGAGEGPGVGGGAGAGLEGTGLDQPVESSRVIITGVDSIVLPDELSADFTFSADTVDVGEAVEFVDTSTGDPTQRNWTFGDGTTGSGPVVVKAWDQAGEYEVKLTVSDASGDSSEASKIILVVEQNTARPPDAQFSLDRSTAEVGETVTFQNDSTGDPDLLVWDFGDGTQANGDVVEHSFSVPGQYTVVLTATNAAGSDTQEGVVTIVDAVLPPEAAIGTGRRTVTVGEVLTLVSESTNSPTRLAWDFGDNASDTGETVRHSWSRSGTYRVRLTATNSAGEDSTFTDVVVTDPIVPPVARFDQSSLEAIVGESITFGDISLNNPTQLLWEFGDGDTATASNVRKAWSSPGQYTVTLTATNEAGADSVTKTVTVFPPPPDPPIAAFRVSAASVPVNTVVAFTDRSRNDPAEWLWDFGDGTTSTAKSPPHAFAEPGTYEVTLTVTNVSGEDSTTRSIVVIDPPVASFTRTIDELSVAFTDTSLNEPTEWLWNFGDGTNSTVQSPSKTYAEAGTYEVSLTVTNDAGTSSPFTASVTVAERPVASFGNDISGLSVVFTDTSTNGPTSWLWDFGDGTTSTQQSPSHTYDSPGEYTVVLSATNAAGSTSASTTVDVDIAPPIADFSCTSVGAGVSCDGSASLGAVDYAWTAPDAISVAGGSTATPAFTFPATGSYPITLVVSNASEVTDTLTKNIDVDVPEPPVVVSVTVQSNNDGVVQLLATATNDPTTWTWSPDDGTIVSGSNTASPTIQFDTDGERTISATASNAAGASAPESVTLTVNIIEPPVVSIDSITNSGGVITASASATNGPVTWQWLLDGVVVPGQTSANATITVSANDTYAVTAQATNGDGTDSDSTTVDVTDIAAPPVVTGIVEQSNAGGVVTVTASATNSPTSWSWSAPGAIISGGTTPTPTFTYPENGSYTVTVTASNGDGSDSLSTTIVISDGPTAAFTPTATGLSVVFADASTNATGATWSWTFGDSATSTVQNPTHIYGAAGSYTVTLTVTVGGLSSSTSQLITVTL